MPQTCTSCAAAVCNDNIICAGLDAVKCQAAPTKCAWSPAQKCVSHLMNSLITRGPRQLEDIYRDAPAGVLPNGMGHGQPFFLPGADAANVALAKVAKVAWQGKIFDRDNGELKNLILGNPAIPAEVYYGKSWFDGQPAIILDYSKLAPGVFKVIRDEIRHIGPREYLGRVYLFSPLKPFIINFALEFAEDQVAPGNCEHCPQEVAECPAACTDCVVTHRTCSSCATAECKDEKPTLPADSAFATSKVCRTIETHTQGLTQSQVGQLLKCSGACPVDVQNPWHGPVGPDGGCRCWRCDPKSDVVDLNFLIMKMGHWEGGTWTTYEKGNPEQYSSWGKKGLVDDPFGALGALDKSCDAIYGAAAAVMAKKGVPQGAIKGAACGFSIRKLALGIGLPAATLGLADVPLLTVCPLTCDAGHMGSGDLGVYRVYEFDEMPHYLGGSPDGSTPRRRRDTIRENHPGHQNRNKAVSPDNIKELGGLQWMDDNGIPDEFFTISFADEYKETNKIFTPIGRDFILYNDCQGLVVLSALLPVYFGPGITGTHETGYIMSRRPPARGRPLHHPCRARGRQLAHRGGGPRRGRTVDGSEGERVRKARGSIHRDH